MRLWPTTVLTPDDWVADLRFTDGTSSRIGLSPHLTEQQALDRIATLVRWRNSMRRLVDCKLQRRYAAFNSVEDMHPVNRGRLTK
jgi:hypothetical protein